MFSFPLSNHNKTTNFYVRKSAKFRAVSPAKLKHLGSAFTFNVFWCGDYLKNFQNKGQHLSGISLDVEGSQASFRGLLGLDSSTELTSP